MNFEFVVNAGKNLDPMSNYLSQRDDCLCPKRDDAPRHFSTDVSKTHVVGCRITPVGETRMPSERERERMGVKLTPVIVPLPWPNTVSEEC